MKKSKIARKCTSLSGVTIAQFVNGCRSSQPQQLVVELEEVKPEVMTFKAFRPVHIVGTGMEVPKISKFVPAAPKFFEVQAITKKEAKELRRLGYQVRLLGPETNFTSATSIIKAVRGVTTITGTGKLTLFDSVGRKSSTTRRKGGTARRGSGVAYSSKGGGGGSGPIDIDFGTSGISFGGGGSGGGTPTSERRFLALILIDIEKQKAILDKQASEIRIRMRQLPEDDDDTNMDESVETDSRPVFNEYINENYMADALFEVYEHYRSKNLFNKDFKPIDLVAYLFVMVAIFGYGRIDFRSNAQKPFFDFFKKKVVPDLASTRGNTRESMGNRLRGKMQYLFPNSTPKNQLPTSKRLEAEKAEKEFLEVYGNFHKTKYGAILKRQLGK